MRNNGPGGGGIMGRRSLQIVCAILALIPVGTGIIGMAGVGDPLYASARLPPSVQLDTNLRSFGGVWVGHRHVLAHSYH